MPSLIRLFFKYQMAPRISLHTCCFVNIVGVLSVINLLIAWCRNDARRGLTTFKSVPCGKCIFL